MKRLRAGLPDDVLLVLDAAYAEYVRANDYEAGIELVATTHNTVMTRTFSKIYGLASLRIGWAYCPTEIADALNRIRGPFNVSGPAIAAGVAALEDQAWRAARRRAQRGLARPHDRGAFRPSASPSRRVLRIFSCCISRAPTANRRQRPTHSCISGASSCGGWRSTAFPTRCA